MDKRFMLVDSPFLGWKPFDRKKDRRERAQGRGGNLCGRRPKRSYWDDAPAGGLPPFVKEEVLFGIELAWVDEATENNDRRLMIRCRLPNKKELSAVPLRRSAHHIYIYRLHDQIAAMQILIALDLIQRIANDRAFDLIEEIPLYLGHSFIKEHTDQIGKLLIPPPPFKLKSFPHWVAGRSLSDARHNCTTYDYEWQTGLKGRDDSKAFWDKAIREAWKS